MKVNVSALLHYDVDISNLSNYCVKLLKNLDESLQLDVMAGPNLTIDNKTSLSDPTLQQNYDVFELPIICVPNANQIANTALKVERSTQDINYPELNTDANWSPGNLDRFIESKFEDVIGTDRPAFDMSQYLSNTFQNQSLSSNDPITPTVNVSDAFEIPNNGFGWHQPIQLNCLDFHEPAIHHSSQNVRKSLNAKPIIEEDTKMKSKLLKCALCNYSTPHRAILERHIRKHTNEKPFKCDICSKETSRKDSLKLHMKVHAKRKKYSCSICKMGLKSKRTWKAHNKRCEQKHFGDSLARAKMANGLIEILDCDNDFNSNSAAKIVEETSAIEAIETDTTEKTLENENIIRSVELENKSKRNEPSKCKRFNCTYCNFSAHYKSEVVRHLKIHADTKPFACGMCGKGYTRFVNLKKHRCSQAQLNYDDDDDSHLNEIVGRHIEQLKSDYEKLQKRQLPKEKPFKCDICKKAFTRKIRLKVHRGQHKKLFPFQCSICRQAFPFQKMLKAHEQSCNARQYECYLCKYVSLNRGNLTYHMNIHTGNYPFKCEICGKEFATNQNRKYHMKTHAMMFQFRCSVCSRVFSCETELKLHETNYNHKQFQCFLCRYVCLHKFDLLRHMLVHNGEKRFNCSKCNEKFAYKFTLNAHTNRYHSETK